VLHEVQKGITALGPDADGREILRTAILKHIECLLGDDSFPPGPICLKVPLNNQWKFGPEHQRKYIAAGRAPSVPLAAGDPQLIQQISAILLAAKRPIIVAGDGVYWSDGMVDLQNLATLMQVPTNTRRTARGAVPETDPSRNADMSF
jgi:acetolactate synthase I/II/III large subunit